MSNTHCRVRRPKGCEEYRVGDPDEVYEYSRRLIGEVGPGGFILVFLAAGPGLRHPPNAKLENMQAMIAAAHA
ncbi:MAG: hypothetical protein ACYCX3_14760 [Thermoleophilia bacterium]